MNTDEMRKRAKEIGALWSDYELINKSADEIDALRGALKLISYSESKVCADIALAALKAVGES